MQTSDSIVGFSSSPEDDDAPPQPVPLVVDVVDTDLQDDVSEAAPNSEIIQTHNKPSFTMQTLHCAVDCLSTPEDECAPNSSVHFVVDVPADKNCDAVDIGSSSRILAYDVLHEILSWMPAKSAIKYSTSVYRGLCNIRLDPYFIKKQCIRSCGQDSGFFLQHKNVKKSKNYRISNKFEFHVLPWESGSAYGIPFKSLDFLPKSGHILSSSNGLLLLRNPSLTGGCEFKVCNPAIREWAPLPIPKGYKVMPDEDFSPLIECYPWGDVVLDNVEFPNDYTVALPVSYELVWLTVNGRLVRLHKQELLIYSHGRWEENICTVAIVGGLVRFDMPVGIFSNANKELIVHYMCDSSKGTIYYTEDLEPYIAAFSIREEKLREIKLPDGTWDMDIANLYGPSRKKLLIFKWSETSICLVRWWPGHRKMTAWVLDDCGCEGESWRLVMDASVRELCPEGYRITNVGVAGGGKGLLIATAPAKNRKGSSSHSSCDVFSPIYVFVVDGKSQGRLELVGEHHFSIKCASSEDDAYRFLPYANTLRPVSVQNSNTRSY